MAPQAADSAGVKRTDDRTTDRNNNTHGDNTRPRTRRPLRAFWRSLRPPPASSEPRGLDIVLLGCVFMLTTLGIVLVYSASAVYAGAKYTDGMFFLKRQIVFAALGMVALYIGWRINYWHYQRFVYPLLGLSFLLLVAVLIPGIGTRIDGATRWFRFGGLSFQPSELAKLTLVIYLAHSLHKKKGDPIKLFTIGFLPHLFVSGVFCALILRQPDLGNTAIIMSVTLLMLLIAGTRLSYVLLAVLTAAPIAYQLIVETPWRLRRLLAFLDPWAYRKDAGYQMSESLISVGSGGLSGLGLGAGKQKLFFLPAAHTDFIFAILAEELGLVGVAITLLVFAVFLLRGLRASWGAPDSFGTHLGFGITAMLSLQGLLHITVVLGLVPTKGITLPFVSYGGSALLFNLLCAGILLNIAARNPRRAPATPRQRTLATNRKRVPRVKVAGTA